MMMVISGHPLQTVVCYWDTFLAGLITFAISVSLLVGLWWYLGDIYGVRVMVWFSISWSILFACVVSLIFYVNIEDKIE